ncbi:MAG: hypothetical protein IJ735_07005 [Clostridia bacterium]|nr:hypothetical protein [Clostridia bacterium]
MIYHGKYEIDPSFISDGSIMWKTTGNGEYAFGTYRGKKYFIKRFCFGPRYPSKSLPAPVYQKYLEDAGPLEEKQMEINKRLRAKKLSVDTDHIVVEEESFWDDETNMFVTVTRLITDERSDLDFSGLSQEEFLKLCFEMTTLLVKFHAAGVTHGDLKEKNFFFRDSGSGIVPYLIDFDLSYPSDYGKRKDEKGRYLLGQSAPYSAGYQSPEICRYNGADEDSGATPEDIRETTDIFSLAVVFHKMWTGQFPTVVGDASSVGEAVENDQRIRLDTKFDFDIGPNCENKFSTLLGWMLAKDVDKRPTARQVADAIEDKLDVEEYFEEPGSLSKFDTVPHALHADSVTVRTKDALKGMGVKSFGKVVRGGEYRYLVKKKDGTEEILTVDELINKGYAEAKKMTVDPLWERDAERYEYVDEETMEKTGLARLMRRELGFKKFYYVVYRSGRAMTVGAGDLLREGLTVKKLVELPETESDDKPWPEDGTSYVPAAMAQRGVVKTEKVVEEGVNKYRITIVVDGTTKTNVVKGAFMRLMGYIK